MDILLSHGYFLYADPAERAVMRPYPPLGLLYNSAYLKQQGFSVAVYDSTFGDLDGFVHALGRHRPSVVGLYANLITRRNVVQMIRLAKEAGAWVVLGGPEPANYTAEYLDAGADVVVIGEGEATLEELIPRLVGSGKSGLEAIAGLAFRRDDGELVRTAPRAGAKDLDKLPFPDRAAIPLDQYLSTWKTHHGMSSVSLITARGCVYKCTWCSHAVFGYSHRRRSVGNVVDEIELIRERYRPDAVWYADDVFTINPKWLFNYADELDRRGIKIPFETITREDRLDEKIVETLARMGCFRIWVGSESGSQRVLDAMRRDTDAARVREMVKLLQRHGIEAGMFIMLGYDGETEEDLEATVEHLKSAIPDRLLTTIAYPIKGTPYYEAVKDRVVPRKAWAESSDRELAVLGRPSRLYYEMATRWMVNEVALERERQSPAPSLWRAVKAGLHAQMGRAGMHLFRGSMEQA